MAWISWIILLILFEFVLSDSTDGVLDTWEDPHMVCPDQCVCQRSPFMDLSVARWIQGIRRENYEDVKEDTDAYQNVLFNEAFFDNDDSHLRNPNVKFVMCILQDGEKGKDLFVSLQQNVQDVQALVLIHNGKASFNLTVYSSDLSPLSDLEILEVRSSGAYQNLIFLIDEPIDSVKYANFESVDLITDEKLKKLLKRPSESHGGISVGSRFTYKNDESQDADEYEIVPYDVYKVELSKAMRPSFVNWNNLIMLRIHNCYLDELEWEMFAELNNLEYLSLEHNGITKITPFTFKGVPHLKTLSLARNDIQDINYLDMVGLQELEYLDLSSNNLSKISEDTIAPFTSLKKLDLQENPIEHLPPMTFAILNTTEELILGSKSIALDLDNTHDAFVSLDRLRTMELLNAKSTSLDQTIFTGLMAVERFKMYGSVKRIELDTFAEMPKLKEVILNNCEISEISMDAFYGASDLRIIDLSHNQLTKIPLGLFDSKPQLQEIYLQNNYLKSLPENFFSLESLKLARLTDNRWKCSCDMSKWNQAVTNSIRLNKLSSKDKHCIRNPKTGRFEHCDHEFDDFPQYSYGFDNKMSPLCHDISDNFKLKNVFSAVRKNYNCSHPLTKSAEKKLQKERMKNKFKLYTIEKLSSEKPKKNFPWTRKLSKSEITKNTNSDYKVQEQQLLSNDVTYDL